MQLAEQRTAGNTAMTLNIAASYGGRQDIARAARELAAEVAAGRLLPEQIDEALLGSRVALADLPPPDLFIRTGGDTRVSNFLLWQLAYTELWFTEVLWPEFDAAILQQALDAYAVRERRFGLTSAQIAALATETSTP
jgi:undecaprenyl diphosphate synthase